MRRRWRAVLLILVVGGILLVAVPTLLGGPDKVTDKVTDTITGQGPGPIPAQVPRDPAPTPASTPLARIAIAGDIGTRDDVVRATADEMVDQSRELPYDALVLLGDLVYEEGDADLARASVLQPFDEVLDRGAVLIPALGNHDIESGEGRQILRRLGRDSAWYEQRVGPVRFLVLDSNRPDLEAQTAWLRAELAEPQPEGTWTIPAMHHPPYSAGDHGSDLAVRGASI